MVTRPGEWMPQYWASFGARVSREKAPALAQPFGRRRTLPIPDCLAVAAFADRSAPTGACEGGNCPCCRFVTVQTIRDCLVSPDAKLCSFIVAVYELPETKQPPYLRCFALRQIVAKSLQIKALDKKSRGYLRLIFSASHSAAARRKLLMRRLFLMKSCSKPWGILRLLTLFDQRKGRFQGLRSFGVNLGVLDV